MNTVTVLIPTSPMDSSDFTMPKTSWEAQKKQIAPWDLQVTLVGYLPHSLITKENPLLNLYLIKKRNLKQLWEVLELCSKIVEASKRNQCQSSKVPLFKVTMYRGIKTFSQRWSTIRDHPPLLVEFFGKIWALNLDQKIIEWKIDKKKSSVDIILILKIKY